MNPLFPPMADGFSVQPAFFASMQAQPAAPPDPHTMHQMQMRSMQPFQGMQPHIDFFSGQPMFPGMAQEEVQPLVQPGGFMALPGISGMPGDLMGGMCGCMGMPGVIPGGLLSPGAPPSVAQFQQAMVASMMSQPFMASGSMPGMQLGDVPLQASPDDNGSWNARGDSRGSKWQSDEGGSNSWQGGQSQNRWRSGTGGSAWKSGVSSSGWQGSGQSWEAKSWKSSQGIWKESSQEEVQGPFDLDLTTIEINRMPSASKEDLVDIARGLFMTLTSRGFQEHLQSPDGEARQQLLSTLTANFHLFEDWQRSELAEKLCPLGLHVPEGVGQGARDRRKREEEDEQGGKWQKSSSNWWKTSSDGWTDGWSQDRRAKKGRREDRGSIWDQEGKTGSNTIEVNWVPPGQKEAEKDKAPESSSPAREQAVDEPDSVARSSHIPATIDEALLGHSPRRRSSRKRSRSKSERRSSSGRRRSRTPRRRSPSARRSPSLPTGPRGRGRTNTLPSWLINGLGNTAAPVVDPVIPDQGVQAKTAPQPNLLDAIFEERDTSQIDQMVEEKRQKREAWSKGDKWSKEDKWKDEKWSKDCAWGNVDGEGWKKTEWGQDVSSQEDGWNGKENGPRNEEKDPIQDQTRNSDSAKDEISKDSLSGHGHVLPDQVNFVQLPQPTVPGVATDVSDGSTDPTKTCTPPPPPRGADAPESEGPSAGEAASTVDAAPSDVTSARAGSKPLDTENSSMDQAGTAVDAFPHDVAPGQPVPEVLPPLLPDGAQEPHKPEHLLSAGEAASLVFPRPPRPPPPPPPPKPSEQVTLPKLEAPQQPLSVPRVESTALLPGITSPHQCSQPTLRPSPIEVQSSPCSGPPPPGYAMMPDAPWHSPSAPSRPSLFFGSSASPPQPLTAPLASPCRGVVRPLQSPLFSVNPPSTSVASWSQSAQRPASVPAPLLSRGSVALGHAPRGVGRPLVQAPLTLRGPVGSADPAPRPFISLTTGMTQQEFRGSRFVVRPSHPPVGSGVRPVGSIDADDPPQAAPPQEILPTTSKSMPPGPPKHVAAPPIHPRGAAQCSRPFAAPKTMPQAPPDFIWAGSGDQQEFSALSGCSPSYSSEEVALGLAPAPPVSGFQTVATTVGTPAAQRGVWRMVDTAWVEFNTMGERVVSVDEDDL